MASAVGRHRKFPPHARKTSGTQGNITSLHVFSFFLLPSLILNSSLSSLLSLSLLFIENSPVFSCTEKMNYNSLGNNFRVSLCCGIFQHQRMHLRPDLVFQIHFLDFSALYTPNIPIIHFEFAWVKRIRCSERGPLIGLIDFSLAFLVYCTVNCNTNSRKKESQDTHRILIIFCYRGSARKPWGWQHRTRAICTKANLVRWDLFSSGRHF